MKVLGLLIAAALLWSGWRAWKEEQEEEDDEW